jgi:UDP-N-acetylmuramoylalanine--D-glutamate ligase
MVIEDLKDKLVAVLGFGVEGRATAEYLLKHGLKPVLFDERPWDEWDETEKGEIKKLGVNFIFGPKAFMELGGFDVAFRSPGIPLRKLKVKSEKCKVTSQTKFFFDNCKAKIIGVTGTKGKGTTASLIYEILKKQFQISNFKFQNVHLTGNIGKVQPLEILDDLKKDDWVVFELSSFQLQDLEKSPHIGVVLMTTSEHLDYHKDNEEYVEAKTSIVKYQGNNDYAIINADFPSSVKIGEMGKGRKIYFSRQKELESGVFIKDDQIVINDVVGKNFQFPLLRQGSEGQAISNFQLRGFHNLENICASIAAALCAGCEVDAIKSAIENFTGLEHRLEFVAEKNGVKYYNDSFSTTPETAIAAINSFSEPLIVILGGSQKNSDFTELGKVVASADNIKGVVLIGDESARIKRAMGETKIKLLEGAKSMPEIFEQINTLASKGDVVLLSPACASFGMFKNYKDRGQQFRKQVTSSK